MNGRSSSLRISQVVIIKYHLMRNPSSWPPSSFPRGSLSLLSPQWASSKEERQSSWNWRQEPNIRTKKCSRGIERCWNRCGLSNICRRQTYSFKICKTGTFEDCSHNTSWGRSNLDEHKTDLALAFSEKRSENLVWEMWRMTGAKTGKK